MASCGRQRRGKRVGHATDSSGVEVASVSERSMVKAKRDGQGLPKARITNDKVENLSESAGMLSGFFTEGHLIKTAAFTSN